jgi:uncharacterized protein (TIGR02145 family)
MILIMKNVFLVIMVVLIVGCSKDSSEAPPIDSEIVTDLDGNVYETLVIGNQTWFKENLNVSQYQDGTPIPEVTNPAQWATLTTGAWCYYENKTRNKEVYGKLYNWYAVAGIYDVASLNNLSLRKKLAPTGYSIPTDAEWTTLTSFIGSEAGGKMKETDTSNWTSPNSEATNSSGFTALPGGICISNGDFHFIGYYGYWWSATSADAATAWNRSLGYNSSIACRSYDDKNYGFAVRCIKK